MELILAASDSFFDFSFVRFSLCDRDSYVDPCTLLLVLLLLCFSDLCSLRAAMTVAHVSG